MVALENMDNAINIAVVGYGYWGPNLVRKVREMTIVGSKRMIVYDDDVKQEEPLKTECLHFLECIRESNVPLTSGARALDVVKVLEASSASLKRGGSPVPIAASKSPNCAEAQLVSA